MSITETSPELPIWPSGIARLGDGILEVTTGDGIRVAAADIVEVGVEPPRAGRLSLALVYRAGLDRVKRSFWGRPDGPGRRGPPIPAAPSRQLVVAAAIGRDPASRAAVGGSMPVIGSRRRGPLVGISS